MVALLEVATRWKVPQIELGRGSRWRRQLDNVAVRSYSKNGVKRKPTECEEPQSPDVELHCEGVRPASYYLSLSLSPWHGV